MDNQNCQKQVSPVPIVQYQYKINKLILEYDGKSKIRYSKKSTVYNKLYNKLYNKFTK